MIEYLQFLLPYIVQFKYVAVFIALVAAGLGLPLPEEITVILGGYMVSIGEMNMGLTLLVCYFGVIGGDMVTYALGRFGGRWILGTWLFRLMISRRRLSQVQYYYRKYGPRTLLLARQMPGVRFPTFFTAGMLKVPFVRFMAFDGVAALISMPVVFFISFYFGPRLRAALSLVGQIGDVTTISGLVIVVLGVILYLVYRRWYKNDPDGTDGAEN